MRRFLVCLSLAVFPAVAAAQTLTLPATLTVPVGFPVAVKPTSPHDGGVIVWYTPDPDLQEYDLGNLFEPADALKATSRLFYATKPGTYRVVAVCAKGDKCSPFAICKIIVGDAPPPGPGPGPNPPPTPPSPPTPIALEGFRVMMVYKKSDIGKYPKDQLLALSSGTVRDYLNAHCAKGTDGQTAEWRVWQDDVSTANEEKVWQDAFARPRQSLPWIIISNGKTGFEGPLPGNVADTMTLLQKFGGAN